MQDRELRLIKNEYCIYEAHLQLLCSAMLCSAVFCCAVYHLPFYIYFAMLPAVSFRALGHLGVNIHASTSQLASHGARMPSPRALSPALRHAQWERKREKAPQTRSPARREQEYKEKCFPRFPFCANRRVTSRRESSRDRRSATNSASEPTQHQHPGQAAPCLDWTDW